MPVVDVVSLIASGIRELGLPNVEKILATFTNVLQPPSKVHKFLTIFVINHFSHNGGGTHEEIVEEAKKYGFVVSYDSLEIEF